MIGEGPPGFIRYLRTFTLHFGVECVFFFSFFSNFCIRNQVERVVSVIFIKRKVKYNNNTKIAI